MFLLTYVSMASRCPSSGLWIICFEIKHCWHFQRWQLSAFTHKIWYQSGEENTSERGCVCEGEGYIDWVCTPVWPCLLRLLLLLLGWHHTHQYNYDVSPLRRVIEELNQSTAALRRLPSRGSRAKQEMIGEECQARWGLMPGVQTRVVCIRPDTGWHVAFLTGVFHSDVYLGSCAVFTTLAYMTCKMGIDC